MRVTFPWLTDAGEREEAERAIAATVEQVRQVASVLQNSSKHGGVALREPYAHLELERGILRVRDCLPESLPYLRRVAEALGSDLEMKIGLPRCSVEESLARVELETGLRMSETRVRVGVVRGHMLEISWYVPLDVSGGPEELDDAADLLCESLLGSRDYHRWVRANHVVRSARRSGLRTVASEPGPEVFPLEAAPGLLAHAIHLLEAERVSRAHFGAAEWTVFEHELAPSPEAPQAQRVFTATRCPEATKCYLEGALFASSRFVHDGSLFLSVRIESDGEGRTERRRFLEKVFEESEGATLIGTGFSLKHDYFDLLSVAASPTWATRLESLKRCFRLEFWDSELRSESGPLPSS